MFGLFKNKTTKAQTHSDTTEAEPGQPTTPTAPGTIIHYSPTLIGELKEDHQKLFALYGEIQASFDQGDYASVSKQLNEFRHELHGHLLTENVRLYIYLDHMFGCDEMSSALIRSFRREMDGIAKTALNFLKKYEAIGVDKELANAFAKDFASLGTVLTERTKREESVLYPLYTPPY